MISANEAKKLVESSIEVVHQFLKEKVEPQVINAANKGEECTIIYLSSEPDSTITEPQLLYVRTKEELIKLGYAARFCRYSDTYVPKGLADVNGDGPLYRNFGLEISWVL